jgi:hypothetical protein
MIDYSISGSVALPRLDDPPHNVLSHDVLNAYLSRLAAACGKRNQPSHSIQSNL